MGELKQLMELDFRGWLYFTFLLMATLIAMHKLLTEFINMIKKWRNKLKGLDGAEANKKQDAEIETLKARFDKVEDTVNIVREAYMVLNWDRIMHFGMNYISKGYVSFADKDCILKMVELYKKCGGNGHLKYYVPILEALPISEELTDEQKAIIDNDEVARTMRVRKAQASLSAYYVK